MDDNVLVRRGVESVIVRNGLGTLCGEATDGEEGVRKVKELEPDLVLMDSSMPRLDGMEATRQIRQFAPALKIIILTMHDPKQIAFAAQRAGANLVVEKSAVDEQLTRAIRDLWKEGQG